MESRELELKSIRQRRAERHKKLVALSSRIYGIAKILLEVLEATGAEIDDGPTDIKFHMYNVEIEMLQTSSTKLIAAVEDLYYVVHARLKTEINNITLSQIFQSNGHKNGVGQDFFSQYCLPEPKCLKMIFQACLQHLKGDDIHGHLHNEVVRQQQADYIHQTIKSAAVAGYHPEDTLAYRQYIQELVCDPSSSHYKSWKGLDPLYDAAPCMVIATLSEKYNFGLQRESTGSMERYRFDMLHAKANIAEDEEEKERKHIAAHRQATYAVLHGLSAGEYRRRECEPDILQYIREKQCVCFQFCACAKRCTDRSHRVCPCNAHIGTTCGVDTVDFRECFSQRCSDGAAVIFEKLSGATSESGTSELESILATGINAFPHEIAAYRQLCQEAMYQV